MLIERDYWDSDDFGYSAVLDFLLHWSLIRILHQADERRLRILEKEWNSLREQSEVEVSLRSGLGSLCKQVEQALAVLRGPRTIAIDLDEAWQIKGAIEILDHVVLLSEALEYFPDSSTFPKEFRDKTGDLLCQVTIDRAPCGLRLIPLNDWRRKILERISVEKRYLFPWYGSWADVPADTLDRLVDEWDNLTHGQMGTVGIDQGTLAALLAELNTDQDLLKRIRQEARLAKLIPQAIEDSLALRLFALGTEAAALVSIAEVVGERGLVASACKAIREWPRSELDTLEIRFLAAFCGPLLSDGQRIQLLSEVENGLKALDRNALQESALLERVYLWSTGHIHDEIFAEKILAEWITGLEKAANEIQEPIPDTEVNFWAEVNNLLTKRRLMNKIRKVFKILKGVLEEKEQTFVGLEPVGAGVPGRNEIKRTMSAFVELEIKPIEGRERVIFPIPFLPEDNAALKKSKIQAIEDFEECYMWGAGWKGDGEQVPFSLRHLRPIRPYFENDQGFSQIMVCLGTKKEEVEYAKGVIEKWFETPEQDIKDIRIPPGVVIISYKVVREH